MAGNKKFILPDGVTASPNGMWARFGDMVWPCPVEKIMDIEWRLRYGEPTEEDLLCAASVISAYAAMIWKTQAERNRIIKNIRHVAESNEG